MENRLREIFWANYNIDNLDNCIIELKEAGATQIDCIKILRAELNMSIKQADEIVLNSLAWRESREITEKMRKDFDDLLDGL